MDEPPPQPDEQSASTPWRDNIEAVSMAVIMALLLKYFVIEAYKIPSGSMQPTLIGDESSKVFDRILVDKFSYRLRDPRRWEIAVFKYPLDLSKSFVKRVVGVGPEDVRILHGDVWRRGEASEPWEIVRRPRAVQRSMWKRLDREEPEASRWVPSEGAVGWSVEARIVRAEGPGRARFGSSGYIQDDFLDGYPDALRDKVRRKAGTGIFAVGDLRVDGEATVDASTLAVGVDFEEGQMRYELRVPGPAAPGDARPSIRAVSVSRDGTEREIDAVFAAEPTRLAPGATHRFGAQNLDDLLELELDGEVLLGLEVANARDQRAAAYVAVEGTPDCAVEFEGLMAYRDVYYTGGDLSEYHVPAGHYFMLGDNTQDSSDGREWKMARLEPPAGMGPRAEGAEEGAAPVLLGGIRRDDRDLWQKNPLSIRDALTGEQRVRFRDVHGETWWFDGPAIPYASPPTENAPLVPRRLIQGRALAVFWPWSPRLGVYRWKWVR